LSKRTYNRKRWVRRHDPTSAIACDAEPSGAGTSATGTRIPPTTTTTSVIPTATVYQAGNVCGGSSGDLFMGMHNSVQDLRRRVQVIMDRNQQSLAGTQQNISSATTGSSQTTSLQAVLDVLQQEQGDLQSLLPDSRMLICIIDNVFYISNVGQIPRGPAIIEVPA